MKKPLLISACLVGVPCRYDAKSKPTVDTKALEEHFRLIPVCPEVLGGLSTPRTPCEIVGNRVMDKKGIDRTETYFSGAKKALAIANEEGAHYALLKEKSPSCGTHFIYDGQFQRRVISGQGVTAELLLRHQIRVYSEDEIDRLIKETVS